jgi:Tfp pilus assembly protein PilX
VFLIFGYKSVVRSRSFGVVFGHISNYCNQYCRRKDITLMKKIRTILNGRSTDEGFGLAVSVGFSLVAIMIGMTIVGRSLKDSGVSAAQKTTSRSLSAAEAGVTRYLSLINSDRYLANYPHTAATGESSWATSTTIPRGGGSCASGVGSSSTATVSPNQIADTWTDLDSSNSQKGQYRLISYTPPVDATDTGKLVVEGRISQRGAGSTASGDVSTGTTKLQVDISVTPSSSSSGTPVRGVWVTDVMSTKPSDIKDDSLNADIVECGTYSAPVISPYQTNTTSGPFAYRKDPQPMPSLPPNPPPSPAVLNTLSTLPSALPRTSGSNIDSYTLETINGVETKVYRYSVTSDIGGNFTSAINTVNSTLTTSANAGSVKPQKILFYLSSSGNVGMTGNGAINQICKETNGTTTAPICDIDNFQIYAYGSSTPTNNICISGNGILQAFILAPERGVGVNGGGKNPSAIDGAVWAKKWACSNSGSRPLLTQRGGNWGNLGAFLPSAAPPPPTVSAIRNWKILPSS